MIARTVRNAALGTLIAGAMMAGTTATPALAQDDRVVAEVNGQEVMLSEVEAAMAGLPQQAQQMPREMLIPMLAEQLATGKLIAERAYAEGLEDSEAVQERLQQVEEQIVQEVWIDQAISERMTDDVVQETYDTMMEASPPQEEVSARHILVESREEAEAAIGRLDEGEDFAELAGELSTGPTGESGGDLGWFAQGDMVPGFAEAAFGLEAGSYTAEPVETQFGWHVILVEDKRTAEQPALDEIRAQVEQQATRQIIQDVIADLQSDSEIILYDGEGNEIDQDAAPAPAPGAAPLP
ncbi:peptidylprolyl isomerase [Fodinicurvata sp. EGI_FJ10296]|uniref:peptidylprolyl isomerase n=1 Tax=Fodinicurvata sp. EGI_FJ10296 TaxID=3231908 RepID=UPI003451FF4A